MDIREKKLVEAELTGRIQSGHGQKAELGPVRRGKEGQELRGQEAEALRGMGARGCIAKVTGLHRRES